MNQNRDLEKDFSEYKIFKKGSIVLAKHGSYLQFDCPEDESVNSKTGCVYLWVKELNGKPTEVIYVGLTKATVKKRNDIHSQGFKEKPSGSESGRKLRDGLLNCLVNQKSKVGIYIRHADPANILGEMVSLCYPEETALIKKYKPILNKLK
jgi:hypothetical protein